MILWIFFYLIIRLFLNFFHSFQNIERHHSGHLIIRNGQTVLFFSITPEIYMTNKNYTFTKQNNSVYMM